MYLFVLANIKVVYPAEIINIGL